MSNQYLDLHKPNTEKIKLKLTAIRSKCKKCEPLLKAESLIIADLLDSVIDRDGYKIPKKHGGQKKYDELYKHAIAYEVMKLVSSGELVKDAVDMISAEYFKGDVYVRRAYNLYKNVVTTQIKFNPNYKKILEKELAR